MERLKQLLLAHKFFILLGAAILIFIVLLLLPFQTTRPQPGEHFPTRFPEETNDSSLNTSFSPMQKTRVGQAIDTSSLEQLPDFLKKEILTETQTSYSFRSPIRVRPNEVRTDSNVVVFERIIILQEKAPTSLKISDFENKYGQPERRLTGSRFYDELMVTYIYAQRGFAFIGNQFTDEVFELHLFKPMTPEEYIAQFGQDINTEENPHPLGE